MASSSMVALRHRGNGVRRRIGLGAEQPAPLAVQVFNFVIAVEADQGRYFAGDDGAAPLFFGFEKVGKKISGYIGALTV